MTDDAIDFGILLGLAFRAFVDEMHADLAARGFDDLGRSYGYVFRVLGDGDRSLSELAALLGMTLPGAGKIVDEMERRGYVERRPDRVDRRVKHIALSRRGRDALAAARAFHRDLEEHVPDSARLRRGLKRLAGQTSAAPLPVDLRPL
jgi:DNA-binding MarR family transcriptional regulator